MNRLADSLSPYLLQHQNNPVDWFPWCEEAFQLARETDRPIFLSVGYAACHWCHVMEHESFENEAIAEFLNKYFVAVKVDREERPDIDQIYMNAVQVMTGRGGWPMSVFLDHDRRPFYAGTYWPPADRGGMPGFAQVLDAIASAWAQRRKEVNDHADQITQSLRQLAIGCKSPASETLPTTDAVDQALTQLLSVVDRREGGFGAAPKFPHATDLLLILQRAAKTGQAELCDAVNLTLDKMACGGLRDHMGGGFSRYSVDAKWLVPHFEKMLYDNGLLASVYLQAAQVTGQARHAEVAVETLDYLVREMTDEAGGFHCSEDADSEGVEGKFYVWQPSEIIEVLGDPRGSAFCDTYDIVEGGNFEGNSIPHLNAPLSEDSFAGDREKLRHERDKRVHPGRDDKIIVAWNALAIEALATSAMILDRRDHERAAVDAAEFIFSRMTRSDGRLFHAYRAGQAHLDAYLDDYAYLANACVTLFECTGNAIWIVRAEELCEVILSHFGDQQEEGTDGNASISIGSTSTGSISTGFFYTADDAEKLITRNKDWHDGSLVSGNASAARAMWRLHGFTHRLDFREAARGIVIAGAEVITTQSMAAGALVAALDCMHHESDTSQWVFAVPDVESLREVQKLIANDHRPNVLISWVIGSLKDSSALIPLNQGKQPVDGDVTWYRCKNQTCDEPIIGVAAIRSVLSPE